MTTLVNQIRTLRKQGVNPAQMIPALLRENPDETIGALLEAFALINKT